MSTSTSEFDLNLNGIVTDINDLKSKTNPATNTTQGIARVATTSETTNGETVGSSPAFVTPEQVKEKINNIGYGVTLISTRTTTGDWTIPNLIVNRPVFVIFFGTNSSSCCFLTTVIGCAYSDITEKTMGLYDGYQQDWSSSNCCVFIPTGNSITITITGLSNGTVVAYQ